MCYWQCSKHVLINFFTYLGMTYIVGILARRRTTSPRTFTLLLRHIYIIVIVVKSVREK